MRLDKFTTRFQESLASAETLASANRNSIIEPEHLLLALLDSDEQLIRSILSRAGVKNDALKTELRAMISNFPQVDDVRALSLSHSLNRLLIATEKLSQDRNDQYVSTELFLLAAIVGRN